MLLENFPGYSLVASLCHMFRTILRDWLKSLGRKEAIRGCGRFLGDNHAAIPWL